jgi:hypothetical protein
MCRNWKVISSSVSLFCSLGFSAITYSCEKTVLLLLLFSSL